MIIEFVLHFVYRGIAIVFPARTEIFHRTTSRPGLRSLSLLNFGHRELFS